MEQSNPEWRKFQSIFLRVQTLRGALNALSFEVDRCVETNLHLRCFSGALTQSERQQLRQFKAKTIERQSVLLRKTLQLKQKIQSVHSHAKEYKSETTNNIRKSISQMRASVIMLLSKLSSKN